MSKVVFIVVGLLLLVLFWVQYPKFKPHEPGSGGVERGEAPVILVGRIVRNQAVSRRYAPEWDSYEEIREYRVRVKVEKVLRGDVTKPEVSIYYFGYVSNVGGPPRLGMREDGGRWELGDSVIFFLQRQHGELRTVCDFVYYCGLRLFTGVHPNLKVDRKAPVGCSIANLMLSRGPETTNPQLVEAILDDHSTVFSEECTRQRWKELEQDASPMVREAVGCVERATADWPCQMRFPSE